MLHGYRSWFHLESLRALLKTSEDWTPPENMWTEGRRKIEISKELMKATYDQYRHINIHYVLGEIVVMKRVPNSTGECTKLQDRYCGPLTVTEVLPSDVSRVVELNSSKGNRFATTANTSWLPN